MENGILKARQAGDLTFLRRVGSIVFWLAFVAILFVVFWWVGFFSSYAWLVQKLRDFTGLDVSKARLFITFIMVAGIFFPPSRFLIPWRYRGRLVACAAFATFFSLAFDCAVPPGRYILRTTGGYIISDRPGFDTEFQAPLERVTLASSIQYVLWKLHPRVTPTFHSPCRVIVSPKNGEVSCWWHRRDDEWHFSPFPGFCPLDDSKLERVTSAVLSEFDVWRSRHERIRQQYQEEHDKKQQAGRDWDNARTALESSDAFKSLTVAFESAETCPSSLDHHLIASNAEMVVPKLPKCTVIQAELLRVPEVSPKGRFRLEHQIDQEAYAVWRAFGLVPGQKLELVLPIPIKTQGTVTVPAGSIIAAVVTARTEGHVIRVGLKSISVRTRRGSNRPFDAHAMGDGTIWRRGAILKLTMDEDFDK